MSTRTPGPWQRLCWLLLSLLLVSASGLRPCRCGESRCPSSAAKLSRAARDEAPCASCRQEQTAGERAPAHRGPCPCRARDLAAVENAKLPVPATVGHALATLAPAPTGLQPAVLAVARPLARAVHVRCEGPPLHVLLCTHRC